MATPPPHVARFTSLLLITFSWLSIQGQAAIPPMTVTPTTNPEGTAYDVMMPGYFGIQLGSGDRLVPGADYHGLVGFWDLKNDPSRQHNLAAMNVGMIENQWGLKNNDGSLRHYEFKNGPGTITLVESNNVRTIFKYHYPARPFGDSSFPIDPDVTIDEYYALYRPDKIYHTFKLSNSNVDGKGPLHFMSWEFILKASWAHVSNEPETLAEWNTQQTCPALYQPMTPSPWLYLYQDPLSDYRNKTYLFYSRAGNSSYPLTGSCAGVPTPGDISVCTRRACNPAGISGHVPVYSNFLGVIKEFSGDYIANPFQYFMGARSRIIQSPSTPLPAGTDVFVRHAVVFAGDNGVTTKPQAVSYADEYRNPPTLTMQVGSTQGFNPEGGSYELTASGSIVDFTTAGLLRNPAFNIASWSIGVPTLILAGTTALALDTDFVAVEDQGRLLIQVLATLPAGTRLQIPAPSGTNFPPVGVTLAVTVPPGGFTAPANIPLGGSATDPDGIIAQIAFFDGSTLIGTDTQPPFGMIWSNVGAGIYSVSARATDNSGATRASSPVTITVLAPNPVSPVTSQLGAVKVFPNPWRKDRHPGIPITFSNIASGAEVSIFTTSGHLVKKWVAAGTSTTWDATTKSGVPVASGIYLYTVSDHQGAKAQGKLAVIH